MSEILKSILMSREYHKGLHNIIYKIISGLAVASKTFIEVNKIATSLILVIII